MSNETMVWTLKYPEHSKTLFEEVDGLMGYEIVSTHQICLDLWALYCDKYGDEKDRKWSTACALALIYKAGYIQGIRQERKRRRKEA